MATPTDTIEKRTTPQGVEYDHSKDLGGPVTVVGLEPEVDKHGKEVDLEAAAAPLKVDEKTNRVIKTGRRERQGVELDVRAPDAFDSQADVLKATKQADKDTANEAVIDAKADEKIAAKGGSVN